MGKIKQLHTCDGPVMWESIYVECKEVKAEVGYRDTPVTKKYLTIYG